MKAQIINEDSHKTLVQDISGATGEYEYSVEKNARLTLILLSLNAHTSDTKVTVRLAGAGSYADIIGIIIGSKQSTIGLHTLQSHEAPETTSNLLVKTALRDNTVCLYDGGIRVEKKAQKTDAYQRNENILLSEKARAESKPSLEILANDVRCTHGATVGPVSKDELWYLATRGIKEKIAESLIVTGFFQNALDRIEDKEIKSTVWQTIQSAL